MDKPECPMCGCVTTAPPVKYLNRASPDTDEGDNLFCDLSIYNCADCGFGWALPYISWQQFLHYYKHRYRAEGSLFRQDEPVNAFTDYHFDTRSVSQILLGMIFRDFEKGDSFLDIGCGSGYSFWTAKRILPEMRYFAIEPDKRCYHNLECLGVTILGESLDVVEHGKFDFILLSHTLEHYNGADIITILKTIKSLLSDKGIFICEVPLFDIARYKDNRYNDVPHLSFFTEGSMRIAIGRAGLTLEFLKGCGQRYSDWWNECRGRGYMYLPKTGSIHRLLRMVYRASPSLVRDIYERFRMVTPIQAVSSDDFIYGKDRTCIRVVCGRER